jgi:hypothetical protein
VRVTVRLRDRTERKGKESVGPREREREAIKEIWFYIAI